MKKNIIQIKSHNKIFKNKSIKKDVNVLRKINQSLYYPSYMNHFDDRLKVIPTRTYIIIRNKNHDFFTEDRLDFNHKILKESLKGLKARITKVPLIKCFQFNDWSFSLDSNTRIYKILVKDLNKTMFYVQTACLQFNFKVVLTVEQLP